MRARLGATVVIWAAFAVTVSATVGQIIAREPRPVSQYTLIGLVLILALAATLSTFAVWHSANRTAAAPDDDRQYAARRRIARLSLPDEDCAELRRTLAPHEHAETPRAHHRQG